MARERNNLILADVIATKADEHPDLNIVTFEGGGVRQDEVRTYGDLLENGNRIAHALISHGMAPGDRFALLMRNHPEFIETMVAASLTGCVFVPIDPRTRGAKLAYTLSNSNCKGIIAADYALPYVKEVQEKESLPDLQWVIVLESDEGVSISMDDVTNAHPLGPVLDQAKEMLDPADASPDAPFQIMYTSGTTGDPKGVVMAARRYVEGGAMFGMFLDEDDRSYTGLSLTHGNAQGITLASSLMNSRPCVISRKFTKSRLWDICREHGCTLFNLLGGMSTAVYSEPVKPNDADNPVRRVLSAGMPVKIWEAFEDRFNLRILEAYGAVEGGFAFKPIGEGPIGSFGKPPPNLEMKIVDEDGNECPHGEMGELISRPLGQEAPKVEYFKNEEASGKKTSGGWLRSGDICHRDEGGWFYYDYRKGGGLRHNGDFVNPGFVEKVVADHPLITDVFVYGVPASSGAPGEKDVVAAIVPVDAETLDPASVFALCRKDLESNFVPTYLHVVDEIPKTASEKPQERFLLDAFSVDAANIFTE
jgi:crotonobetaine/carnitine-CoA ligase